STLSHLNGTANLCLSPRQKQALYWSKNMDLSELFLVDEVAWLEESARLIKEGRVQELDFANLKDYLESSAAEEKAEVSRRLTDLLVHLLDWQIDARPRSAPWHEQIFTQRNELADLLSSPCLHEFAAKDIGRSYTWARRGSAATAKRDVTKFPARCPYTLEQILDEEFYPEGPLNKVALAKASLRRKK